MSRARLVVVVAAVALASAGAAAWFLLLRDEAEPVTVDEALTSFRTDTEPAPKTPSPIPEGVYVYATTGYEKTDALTGVTHRYPRRSTITVTAADCGASLDWRVLDGRSTTWIYCVTPGAWLLDSQDERHTFFGRTERTTYVCDDTPIRRAGSRARYQVSCATETSRETGRLTLLGREQLRVGGESVMTEHVRKTTWFTGEIRGTAGHDIWYDADSGVPVKVVMVSRTTNDSAVGDVHYEEDARLVLTSLTPRR